MLQLSPLIVVQFDKLSAPCIGVGIHRSVRYMCLIDADGTPAIFRIDKASSDPI